MAKFRCNACKEEYEDYYPPDDTCLKCGKAEIRIVQQEYTSEDLSRLLAGLKVKLDAVICRPTAQVRFTTGRTFRCGRSR